MTKYHCSSTLFPLEICPKTQDSNIFHIRVHTITLNTVTKCKVYPYIQTSLNQIFGIFNNLKILKND